MYSKNQILTEYINRVNFGYLNYGIKSAAKYYFNQEPRNLTHAEQLALLTLPKDPKKYDPYNKPKNFQTRFEGIVNTLMKEHTITKEEEENIMRESLNWNREHENPLPYVVDFLKAKPETYQAKAHIRTTFDRELTEQIDMIAKNTLSELTWRNVSDYGILIAERGDITPLTKGGRGDFSNTKLRVMIGGTNYMDSID